MPGPSVSIARRCKHCGVSFIGRHACASMRSVAPPLEKAEQKSVVEWLRRALPVGSIIAAVPNEAPAASDDNFARARFYEARAAIGVLEGFPDLILLLPGGRTFLLEMKRQRTGILSEPQRDLHRGIRAIGHQVGVADGIDVARHVLTRAGVPLRERDPYAHADQSALEARAERLATRARPKSTAAGRRMRKIAAVNRTVMETLPR